MATESEEIVPVDGESEEMVTTESKIEYSVKSEVISTVKTHETVVTEVRTETIESNHVQESIEAPSDEPKALENGHGEAEEKKEEETAPVEDETPKENGETEEPSVASESKDDEAVESEEKVQASSDVVVEAEVPVTSDGEKSPEEEVQPKVILHQLPRVKDLVSQSPQCLALETFIRMADLPYDNEYEEKAQDVSKENKGKIPYICYKKNKVEGLKNCLHFLKKEFEVATDSHLLPQDEAIAHAFRTMIEESTYWSLMYYRWVDNYSESKKMFSKLPPVLNVVSPKMFQNKCKKSIESHVIGRYNREELYNIAEQDLTALSTFLGEKTYFLGEQPCSFDAIAFGLVANFDSDVTNCPQSTLIREKLTNLHDFCVRMKEKFWSDWDDLCGAEKFQDKPKSSIKKRFSFRKTKTNKEGEPTSPTEEKTAENGETKENGEGKENGEEETKENGEAAAVNGETTPETEKAGEKEEATTTTTKDEAKAEETPAEIKAE